MNELVNYFLGFLINLAIIFIIVRFIYYPKNPDKNNIFTFIGFSSVIFFVIQILTNIELSIGVGFGLFALFSILRYRTDAIPIRDMTYLFITIALSIMNSLMFSEEYYSKLIIANISIILVTLFLEREIGFSYIEKKTITYEKIDLIVPNKREELIEDLKERLGINSIKSIQIGNVNFLKDSTEITIFYKN